MCSIAAILSLVLAFTSINALPEHNRSEAREACGGTIFEPEGDIYSPGYPENYPPSTDCSWVIFGPAGKTISLDFVEFSLDYNSNCLGEYMEVIDYESALIFCGASVPADITSMINTLIINFHSDDQEESGSRKFKLHYKIGEGGGGQDPCLDEPCENGGTCSPKPNPNDGFTCECVDGFFGTTCECSDDPCLDLECGDNGVCVPDGCASATCSCKPGFEEVDGTCEDINECDDSPCHPDANCANTPGSFTCTCKPGFEGDGIESCEPGEGGECPEGFEPTPGGTSCFKEMTGLHTFPKGQELCEKEIDGGSMPCVKSLSDRLYLATLPSTIEGGTWVGMQKDESGEIFCLNGATPDEISWYPGEPTDNRPGEDYLYIRPYNWAAADCEQLHQSLCAVRGASTCPSGFTGNSDVCFKNVPQLKNFEDARTSCKALHSSADLTSILDEDELGLATDGSSFRYKGGPYWLGLEISGGSGSWVDGSSFSFEAWMDGEPGTGACGLLARSHMADSPASLERSVICEAPLVRKH